MDLVNGMEMIRRKVRGIEFNKSAQKNTHQKNE
jgi:hypothetical protein